MKGNKQSNEHSGGTAEDCVTLSRVFRTEPITTFCNSDNPQREIS